MPAVRLENNAVAIRRFDVVGQDAGSLPQFVRHVALSTDDQPNHHSAASLRLTHMGPPLGIGDDCGPINVIGSVPLTVDETLQISLFVDELRLEYEAHTIRGSGQYCIRPHTESHRHPNGDTTILFRRFSCAGFVIEAYKESEIKLVVTDEDQLPGVELATVCEAYPDLSQLIQNQRFRDRYQLNGDGPWPMILAGYVLNALNRPEAAIRAGAYLPQPGDEYFPSHH